MTEVTNMFYCDKLRSTCYINNLYPHLLNIKLRNARALNNVACCFNLSTLCYFSTNASASTNPLSTQTSAFTCN